LRILQLAPLWETVPPPAYGGTEAVIHCLTEELVRRGHEVTLFASGDSQTSAELRWAYPTSLRSAGLCDDGMQYSLLHVGTALREADTFDVVHNHSGPPLELGMALSAATRTPMLTTTHNPPTNDTRFIWQNYRGWYNAISEQQLRTLPVLPQAKSAGAVLNAIDVASFPFEARKQDYLLFLGRITADKGPHLAIEAAQRLGMRIVLAGKVALTSEHEYFEAVIRPLLGPGVEFIGEADAAMKRDLYAGARALLMPLQWDEPFGLVMIEAMACGTPAIVFNRGAAPEIVRDGETGFLVDDVAGMVEAVRRVQEIDPLCCRGHVEACFSPAALADAYESVYARMLGRREDRHDYLLD
jgi:glycosyltransferase involved in cell wall biosynthesis